MDPVPSQPGAPELFALLDDLARTAQVVIDRPRGSAHPRIPAAVYPLDDGYLDGTRSGDGEGIDVFVGTLVDAKVTGILVTADRIKRDAEIKVLLSGSPDEVEAASRFVRDILGLGGLLVLTE